MNTGKIIEEALGYFCQLINIYDNITDDNVYEKMRQIGICIDTGRLDLFKSSLLDHLAPQKPTKTSYKIDLNKFVNLLVAIKSVSEVNINHLGIGYYVNSIEDEVYKLKTITNGSLYEENSGINARWLFTGNVSSPEMPLFELVLKKAVKPTLSSWTPHLQLDFDTSLNIRELEERILENLGVNWVKWRMESLVYGTPLIMGRMYSVDGLKIYIGIGTTDRDRDWHRKIGLTKV